MTQGNASFTYVPGFDFGLVATVEEDVRDVYVSFKSSNGDSSAFIFPCGATRRHGSSLVLHLHHLFAVRCNYTFGSLLSFHLCFMDHSCLIQYSFNTGSRKLMTVIRVQVVVLFLYRVISGCPPFPTLNRTVCEA